MKDYLNHNAFTIGEVGGQASIDEAIKYASFNSNEVSMVFNSTTTGTTIYGISLI